MLILILFIGALCFCCHLEVWAWASSCIWNWVSDDGPPSSRVYCAWVKFKYYDYMNIRLWNYLHSYAGQSYKFQLMHVLLQFMSIESPLRIFWGSIYIVLSILQAWVTGFLMHVLLQFMSIESPLRLFCVCIHIVPSILIVVLRLW